MIFYEGFWVIPVIVVAVSALAFSACLWRRSRDLRKQGLVWQEMFETFGYGIVSFDSRGRVIIANKQACVFFPFLDSTSQTSKGRNLSDFFDYLYDHAVDYSEILKKALEKLSKVSERVDFREVVKTEFGVCLVELHRIKYNQTILIVRDVSVLMKGEHDYVRLNDYSFELTEAIRAATNGIVLIDYNSPNFPIVFANEAFCRYVMRLESEVFGAYFKTIMCQVFDESSCDETYKALDGGGFWDINIQNTSKVNAKVFNLKLSPVINRSGDSGLCVGIFTDITALKTHEAESSKAKKLEALGQLAAGVAHDFNNILSIVDGYARLAMRELDDDVGRDYFEKISKASVRGADLTKQMLTFSRNKVMDNTVVDLGEVLSEQKILLQPLVDASIDFSIDAGDMDDCFIECPADSITQIVMNLTVNARDAIKEEKECGAIEVTLQKCAQDDLPKALLEKDTKPQKGYVRLCVSDDGMGMGKDLQEKIFDPFFTTKDQGKGTGLGLSMVYGLVQQAGGHIDIQSDLGEGTTFFVYFPLSDESPIKKSLSGTLDDLDSIKLEGYSILIAEDEPDLLALVAGMVERLGATVITAANGNEALLKQEEHEGKIDLLLTDVVMPELGGIKLAEMFRELRPDTKVLFISGYPASGDFEDLGLDEKVCFMAKPIKYEILCRQIFELLSQDFQKTPVYQAAYWQKTKSIEEIIKGET